MASMNPAERFEDEKRRIIESCFSKRDPDGGVSESYITHIRITEDGAYPSSPPPPESAAQNKKDRVIIVAVRRAGRVQMHKARENPNKSFSVGKTWMLDHLTAIESFTGVQPRSTEEAQRVQWAGSTGMLVTIQKPYFWQATSQKEKDFFIGSLVKIHRKYAGRDPQLTGFTPQEMATIARPGAKPALRQPLVDAQRQPMPSPGLPPPGGMSMGRQGSDQGAPSRDRFQSTVSAASVSSVGSNYRPDSRRRDIPGGFPDEPDPLPTNQDLRNRLNPARNGSPSNKSNDSYGTGVLGSERDRRQGSQSSFDSAQTRSQIPPGRTSSDRSPLNTNVPPPLSTRGPVPGTPPVPNPRSPDRRGAPPLSQSPIAMGGAGLPPPSMQPLSRNDASIPPERRRPPIMNVPGSPGEGSRGSPDEPPLRNNMRLRNESNASNLTAGSISEISRPSTAGRQPSPHRPPALNLRSDTRQRDDMLRPGQEAGSDGIPPLSATSGPVSVPDAIPTLPGSAGESKVSGFPSPLAASRQTPKEFSREEPREQTPTATAPSKTMQDVFRQLDVMSPTESASPSTPTSPEENYRPGLGPMIKKKSSAKDVASKFRKAAAAANAFRPRANGAGERMLKNLDKPSDGADGVTGVFVPPKSPLLRSNTMESEKSIDDVLASPVVPKSPPPLNAIAAPRALEPEKLKEEPRATPLEAPKVAEQQPVEPIQPKAEPQKPKQPSADELRKKQLSNHAAKYAKALGVNPILLEGRTADIEAIFDDIGWAEGKPLKRSFMDLQAEIKRELSRVETGSWLDAFEGTDDRVVAVSTMLDRTIAECEELDGLLTLYNVELGTLNDDIQFIEAQSQGLQVQTANQRQLALELQNLLKTISIPNAKLAILQEGSLSKPDGLAVVEDALSDLYKALITIDPTLPRLENPALLKPKGVDAALDGNIGNMQAVQDKRATYIREATDFVMRLRQFLEAKFKDAEAQVLNTLGRNRNNLPADVKLDTEAWHNGRKVLWMYSPVMMFARNIVPAEWEELIAMYGNTVKSTYRTEIRKSIEGWKVIARRPTGSEQDAFFTTPAEKEAEGMGRKLTVKRSKTLREGPRVAPGDRSKQEGRIPAYQAFYSALLEICKAIFVEQNFVVKLFHATSTDNTEFPDLVAATKPMDRDNDSNLTDAGAPEFGGPYGARVKQQMANIFYTFSTDLQALVDITVDQNPLHMIGVMYAIEDNRDKTQHTNQDFLHENLNRVHDDLERKYIRFIDEQMSAIDATKVKISKRKGVISFMKVFPLFASAIEDMLPSPAADSSEIRSKVNNDYQKIYRAMSKALIEVGNKDQDAGVTGGDEEKEQLNHHILLIENHNHFIEEVGGRNNPVLIQSREESEQTMAQHMADYVDSVVRRPLGPLLSAVESAEAAIGAAEADGAPPTSIATLASHRANTFRKNVSAFDAKEIRKGVDLLRKRVEKHFGDADDERISAKLVEKVTVECEKRYLNVHERLLRIVKDVYEGQIEIDLKKEDVASAFQK